MCMWGERGRRAAACAVPVCTVLDRHKRSEGFVLRCVSAMYRGPYMGMMTRCGCVSEKRPQGNIAEDRLQNGRRVCPGSFPDRLLIAGRIFLDITNAGRGWVQATMDDYDTCDHTSTTLLVVDVRRTYDGPQTALRMLAF